MTGPTLCRMCFDAQGTIVEVIKPNSDGQLADPSYASFGEVFVDVLLSDYSACQNKRDLFAVALPYLQEKDGSIASLVAANIQAIDDAKAAQAAADAVALAAWIAAHPGETP